jgi:hypothetical protein
MNKEELENKIAILEDRLTKLEAKIDFLENVEPYEEKKDSKEINEILKYENIVNNLYHEDWW